MAATAVLDGLDGGDQHDLELLVDGLDALEHLDAVHAGQPDVEQHEVDLAGADDVEGLRRRPATSMTS